MNKEIRKHAKDALRGGFTLVELLLVVTILGVLASLAVMNLGGLGNDARIQATRADIATIENAVTAYEIRVGRFPENLEKLTEDIGEQAGLLNKNNLTDKWGNGFNYKVQGSGHFEVRSAGPDGVMNTEDDIVNSKSKQ